MFLNKNLDNLLEDPNYLSWLKQSQGEFKSVDNLRFPRLSKTVEIYQTLSRVYRQVVVRMPLLLKICFKLFLVILLPLTFVQAVLLASTEEKKIRLHPLIRDFFQTKSFAYQIVDYSEAFDRLWKLREPLKRGGHWTLLKAVCEKLLPFVEEGKKASCLILLGDICIEFGDLEQAEQNFQNAIPIAQAQGDETNAELGNLQLELISNFRQGDIWDEISFNSKTEYKRLYPNPSELTGFDFLAFLADSNRQSATLSANTQRQSLEYQRELYRTFITEHGESELANTTFLPMIGETLVKLGEAEINAGNLEIAREILQEALEIVNNRGMMKHIALTNYHLARLELFLHNMDLAQIYYVCACNLLQSLGAVRELKRIQQEWQHIMDDCNT
jgi:tetratricopeptide (TPR) repeat protein